MLHGESSTRQASPRMTIQRMCQPQEAVQPYQNKVILQPDTPAQKTTQFHKRSHHTPHEADAHTSHAHKKSRLCGTYLLCAVLHIGQCTWQDIILARHHVRLCNFAIAYRTPGIIEPGRQILGGPKMATPIPSPWSNSAPQLVVAVQMY